MGLQKRDRSSCVSSLWNVSLQSWKTRSSRVKCFQTLRNEIETRASRAVRTNFGSEDIEWWVSDACYVDIALAFLDGQINRLCRTTVFAFGWHPFWTHPFRSYSQMFHNTLTSQRNCGPPWNPGNGWQKCGTDVFCRGLAGPPIPPRLPGKTSMNFGIVIWQCWAE